MATNVSKILDLINTSGKCIITIDSEKKDYLFNGKDPYSYSNDYFKDALHTFNQLITKQLIEKQFDENLASKLVTKIKEQITQNQKVRQQQILSVHFDRKDVRDKNNESVSPIKVSVEAEQTSKRIQEMLSIQKNALSRMKSTVDDLAINYGYILDEDIKNLRSEIKESNQGSIELESIGKMHINLGKKDTITLLTLLEQLDVISFSNTNRNKFIEANFTCKSRDSKPSDIIKMNSDLSNLFDTSGDLGPRNKASFNKLVELLQKKLDGADYKSFAEWLKNSI